MSWMLMESLSIRDEGNLWQLSSGSPIYPQQKHAFFNFCIKCGKNQLSLLGKGGEENVYSCAQIEANYEKCKNGQ